MKIQLPLASLLLSTAALAQGATLPECVINCRPMLTEDLAFLCEVVCVTNGVSEDFNLAITNGEPSIPRFTNPNGCSVACPFGDETFEYTSSDTVVLQAGEWLVPGGGFSAAPLSFGSAEFAAVPLVATLSGAGLASLPFVPLGAGSFNSASGFWELPWSTSAFDDPAGYLLRVELFDAFGTPFDAYTIARDPDSCGFFAYGPVGSTGSSANVLSLSGSLGTCPGSTARYTTAGLSGTSAFLILSLDAAQLALLGGTIWVDLAQQVQFTTAPSLGGQAIVDVPIPNVAALVGLAVYGQSGALDGGAPAGVALSNGLRLDLCPCPGTP